MSLASDIEHNFNANDWERLDIDILQKYLEGCLFWVTKDKKEIKVQDLEESHLRNIIKMRKQNNKSWNLVLEFELKNRVKVN